MRPGPGSAIPTATVYARARDGFDAARADPYSVECLCGRLRVDLSHGVVIDIVDNHVSRCVKNDVAGPVEDRAASGSPVAVTGRAGVERGRHASARKCVDVELRPGYDRRRSTGSQK